MQKYTFSIKHKKGTVNKVADALSVRNLMVQSIELESVGISAMKDMYAEDDDFKEIYQTCQEMGDKYYTNFAEYLIQEGFLFKGGKLCVPRGSCREE